MKSRNRNIIKEARGFTLIEVMVAITILVLVILPLASLYVKSLTVIQNAALYSQAIQLSQERMEICEAVDYGSLFYYNPLYTTGFPYTTPLGPRQRTDYYGNLMNSVAGNAYDNRDNPDTSDVEMYFDPTDSNGENYPVPVYRDYYNNYTGMLLDLNYNGLCDDDLDGDGEFGILAEITVGNPDMEDIEIATNGRLTMYSDPRYAGLPCAALGDTYVPGDGLYDTVVEGNYVSSMDPMYRQVRTQESPSPILDLGLLLDRQQLAATADYRHRETTFQNFVRMTSFIDPTPDLANPNDVNTWVDPLYIRDRIQNDSYTPEEVFKLRLCLLRDLPISESGFSNYDVGIDDAGLVELNAFNVNYKPPTYGIRVIVTVFYLTGEGEMELVDIDGDGVVEEVPMETYGGARHVTLERAFYNSYSLNGVSKMYAPPRRYIQSAAGAADNPSSALTLPDVADNGNDSDPCDLDHNGLPYLQ